METKKEEKLGFTHYMKIYTQEFTDLFQFHILPFLLLNDLYPWRRVSKMFKSLIEATVIEDTFDDDQLENQFPINRGGLEKIIQNLKFRKYSFGNRSTFSTFIDNLERVPRKLEELQIGFKCEDMEQQTLILLSPLDSIKILTVQGTISRARWLSVLLRSVQITHLNFSDVDFNRTWDVNSFNGVKSIRIDVAKNGDECTDIVSELPVKCFFVTLGHVAFNKDLLKGLSLNTTIEKLGYELASDPDVRKKELKYMTKLLLSNKTLLELSIFGRISDKHFKHLVGGLWGNSTLRRIEFGVSPPANFTKKSYEKITELMKAKPDLVLLINTMYTFPLDVALSMIELQSDVGRKGAVKFGSTKEQKKRRQRVFIQNVSVRNEYRGIDAFLTCLEVTMQKNEELEKKVEQMKKKLKKKERD